MDAEDIKLLAALYIDMIESGELDGADAAYDALVAGHDYETADAVCQILNEKGYRS